MTSTTCEITAYEQAPVTMQELIEQYKQSLSRVRERQKTASGDEFTLLSGMASDLQYSLDWMTTGRQPGLRRGIERRAAYQNERPFDPLIMQRYFRSQEPVYEWDDHLQEDVIGPNDEYRIEDAIADLTNREREIYLMSRGNSLTYSQIATYLNISISTVKTNIKRAENKIEYQISQSLFSFY